MLFCPFSFRKRGPKRKPRIHESLNQVGRANGFKLRHFSEPNYFIPLSPPTEDIFGVLLRAPFLESILGLHDINPGRFSPSARAAEMRLHLCRDLSGYVQMTVRKTSSKEAGLGANQQRRSQLMRANPSLAVKPGCLTSLHPTDAEPGRFLRNL